MAAGTEERVAGFSSGAFDVTAAKGEELAAWIDRGRLYIQRGRDGHAQVMPGRATGGRPSPIRWAPSGEMLAWLDWPRRQAPPTLCLCTIGHRRIDRVELPAFAEAASETPPIWGGTGEIVRIICQTDLLASQLLGWSHAEARWRIWERDLPDEPSRDDYVAREDEYVYGFGWMDAAAQPAVVLVGPTNGFFASYQILVPDQMRFVGALDNRHLKGIGTNFTAPMSAVKALSPSLQRAVYVWHTTDGRPALWKALPWQPPDQSRELPLPLDVPAAQEAAFGPDGIVYVLAGSPGAWRVLRVELADGRVSELLRLP